MTNKVSHIVNCCGKETGSRWSNVGIIYLTLNWRDVDAQVVYNSKLQSFSKVIDFIDSALQKGSSVLVYSIRGQSRSGCVVLAYLMQKYHWTLDKTLQFLRFRRPNIKIRSSFLRQLKDFEEELKKETQLTNNWIDSVEIDSEELTLRNTYMNSLKQTIPNSKHEVNKEHRVKWIDEDKKQVLVTIINPSRELRAKSSKSVKTGKKYILVKSNFDITPAKKEQYIKPQSYNNLTEELNKKKYITKLFPYEDNKIITYSNKVDQKKKQRLFSTVDTREDKRMNAKTTGEMGNSYLLRVICRAKQFPKIRQNERIDQVANNFIYSTDFPKPPKNPAWYLLLYNE
jgi:protein-tyrosine phosphatase